MVTRKRQGLIASEAELEKLRRQAEPTTFQNPIEP
jgi:hypothetical protein